jgi:hypothetical protein
MLLTRLRGVRSIRRVRTVASLVCCLPAVGMSQSVSVDKSVIGTDHELLSSRLAGVAGRASLPLRNGPVSIRLGAERLTASSRRIGAPCGGLAVPGTCQPEPMRDDARFTAATAGIGVRMINRHRITLDVIGDASFVSVQVDSRGLTSGGMISADKELWDGDIGAEGTWSPWLQLPLALDVGVAAGRVNGVVSNPVADGYEPFEAGFDVIRLRVGLTWRLFPE